MGTSLLTVQTSSTSKKNKKELGRKLKWTEIRKGNKFPNRPYLPPKVTLKLRSSRSRSDVL